MKGTNVAKKIVQGAFEPLETIKSQTIDPMLEEAGVELGSFFDTNLLGRSHKSIAQEDLQRARDEQKLSEMEQKDNQNSQKSAEKISVSIQEEYTIQKAKSGNEQKELVGEFLELQEEVNQLAKTAGIETKTHLENAPKKIGILDIKRLTGIVRFLRIKAEESKSAQELVVQRKNAKITGMLAWVSGKQMKVHEQGTMLLQG